MDYSVHNTIVSFIWGIADDVLRDVYVRGKYRDVILPMVVIRRLDAVLEPTKQKVLAMKKRFDSAKITNMQGLSQASGQAFWNTSEFTLRDLKARAKQQQLTADFKAYLDGFSPNVQEIIEKFDFRNQIPKLAEADVLGLLVEKFLDVNINLSPNPVYDAQDKIRLPALDNHSMGTIFEELIRRFNEENNEEAGEHFTPRDVVQLMADLIFLPIADKIKSGAYLVYDGACGTGGMLTVAEERLKELAKQHKKEVTIHLYGQEINPETFAITKADLLLKGEGAEAENMRFGSTLSKDEFPSLEFDFMLSNPPYGKSWKADMEKMGGKEAIADPRFTVSHLDEPELNLLTRSSDGQLLFLVNKLSKMKQKSALGSRIAEVHNGSSLCTGDAGQGESNIRRWIIENDWLEAIIGLPHDMFYNTPMETYIWIVSNRKTVNRKGKIQLIDARDWFAPLRKSLGNKMCYLGDEHIKTIVDIFDSFKETQQSRIFPNATFGYWKITVERQLRLRSQFSRKAIEALRFASGDEVMRQELYGKFGQKLYDEMANIRGDIEEFLGRKAGSTETEEGEEDKPKKPVISEKKLKKLLDQGTWKRDHALYESGKRLLQAMGEKLWHDHNEFLLALDQEVNRLKMKLSTSDRKAIIRVVSWRDENAPPVIRKRHKDGTLEYEPDPELRSFERVPFLYEGGPKVFLAKEVNPKTPDAWFDMQTASIGYRIPFLKIFFKAPAVAYPHVLAQRTDELRNDAEGREMPRRKLIASLDAAIKSRRSGHRFRRVSGMSHLGDTVALRWMGEIPEHWGLEKAKYVFREVKEKGHETETLLSVTQDQGVVRRIDLDINVVMPAGSTSGYKLVLPGDFVISLRSFQGGIELSQCRGIVSPAYVVLRRRIPIHEPFYRHLMKTPRFIAELATAVSGVRQGKNITYDDFAEIYLPIPPLNEQEEIASKLDDMIGLANVYKALSQAVTAETVAAANELVVGILSDRDSH